MYINGKMKSVETISGMRVGEQRRMTRGGEFNYDIL
jgi:hypothetical protein